jgi:hypothetical protein
MVFSYLVLKSKYHLDFPKSFYRILIITYIFVVVSFLTVFIPGSTYRYLAGVIVFVMATIFSFQKLNNLMDLRSYISGKFNR